MKYAHLLGIAAAASALLILAAAKADAADRALGPRITLPGHGGGFGHGGFHGRRGFHGGKHGGFHGGFGLGGVWVVEREVPVIIEREVVREVPVVVEPPPPPAPPRKPYAIGASYADLPGGCMKMIEEGVSYYYCSGDWYRQVSSGRGASYKAVARP